ncbi:MAG: four helix bundle protein [Ignavibacteriae bacterium]|nr:four helix bundle protein [Ignavibacteriota bacterium]
MESPDNLRRPGTADGRCRSRRHRGNGVNGASVPSNIAEGAGRSSNRELNQFLSITSGLMSELDTQLTIALRLGYITESDPIFAAHHRASYLLMAYKKSVVINL